MPEYQIPFNRPVIAGKELYYETKYFTCGEGGALLINDPQYIERAEIIRKKGNNRSRFCRGEVDKYTWVDMGSSFLPSDILAAYLFNRLESREWIQSSRQCIWQYYWEWLGCWAGKHGIRLPIIPGHCLQPYHMSYLLLPSAEWREKALWHLRNHGILSVFHYQSLHLSSIRRRYGGKSGDCPVTEDVSDRLLRLLFYNDLTEEDQERVCLVLESTPLD